MPEPSEPYKGLMPYSEEDAPYFFGRTAECETILANLKAERLTLVYGASGVGKTSLLRAGVAHRVREIALLDGDDPHRLHYPVVVFSAWRDDPVAALGTGIHAATEHLLGVDRPATFAEILRCWSERELGDLLVILDQFEEYFLYRPDEGGSDSFAEQFSRAVNDPGLRVNFLVSIREDSVAKLDSFKGRIRNVFANYLRVDHLNREAARDAIRKPVEEYSRRLPKGAKSFEVEDQLVEAVLDQVPAGEVILGEKGLGKPDTGSPRPKERIETPYLQLVMSRLWREERESPERRLRLATLQRLGGAARIVKAHLDEQLEALSPARQDICAGIFQYLVTPSGTKIAHKVSDLAAFAGSSVVEIVPVLENLSGRRILRKVGGSSQQPAASLYEIFHDVLASAILDWRARYMKQKEQAETERKARELQETLDRAVEKLKRFSLARQLAAAAISNLALDPERSVLLALEAADQTYSAYSTITREAEDAVHRAIQSSQLRRTLRDHQAEVNALAYSPDGAWIATAGADQTVRLWDSVSGESLKTIFAQAAVNDVAFDPQGTRLASACADGVVRIWDLKDGHELPAIPTRANGVYSVAFSPDGKLVATGGPQGGARLWDTCSQLELLALRGHSRGVHSIAFSPDGNRVATASRDCTARVWDAGSGRLLLSVSGCEMNRVVFSPDGTRLATACGDGSATVWDARSGAKIVTLAGHENWVNGVAFSPDGHRLATASADRSAKLWDVETGRELLTFSGHGREINGVAFNADGTLVATASADKTVRLWNAAPPGELFGQLAHSQPVNAIALSIDGKYLATASADRTARLWDAGSGRLLHTLSGHTREVNDICFSGDGKRLVTASADHTAKVWEVATGRECLTLCGNEREINGVAFNASGTLVVTAGADRTARVWDTGTGQLLRAFCGHKHDLCAIAFCSDGRHLATSAWDTYVMIWDALTGDIALSFIPHTVYSALAVVFSPDGKRLATSSSDKTAKVWDASSGQELLELRGHTQGIRHVVFSADGRRLATASKDKTVKVWDAESGEDLLTLSGHTGVVNGAVFSPDGKLLTTCSADGTIRVYVLDVEDLLSLARQRVTRSLTAEEARGYLHGR